MSDDVNKLEVRRSKLEEVIDDTVHAIDLVGRLLECTQMSVSDIEREIPNMQREIDRKKYESDNACFDLSRPQIRHNPTDSSFEKRRLTILTRLLEEKRRLPEVEGLNEFFDGTWDRLCASYKRAIGYIEGDLSALGVDPSNRARRLELLDKRKLRREQLADVLQKEHEACMYLIDRLPKMPAVPNVDTALSRLRLMETAIRRDMDLVAVDLEIAALERQIEDISALSEMQGQIAAHETRLHQALVKKNQIKEA
jgi:hypothetical protein